MTANERRNIDQPEKITKKTLVGVFHRSKYYNKIVKYFKKSLHLQKVPILFLYIFQNIILNNR
jgi:hypothetical protein